LIEDEQTAESNANPKAEIRHLFDGCVAMILQKPNESLPSEQFVESRLTCSMPRDTQDYDRHDSTKSERAKAEALMNSTENPSQILLVDDEEMVVTLMQRILETQGYRVVVKTSPNEALKDFYSRPYEIDLVITDYAMPLMTGVELARRIFRIRPDIPIILVTGFSAKMTEDTAKTLGFRRFATKPLGRADLIDLVRGILEEDNQRGSKGAP